MIEVYSPQNAAEQAIIESILIGEGIQYTIRNDNFGAMNVGPLITSLNDKMIMVSEKDYHRADELIKDFLSKTETTSHISERPYSIYDKLRLAIEAILFRWIIPGRKKRI